MKLKPSALLIVALASIAFAHDTLVSIATSYASGIVKLSADSDTVVFSNGIKIFSRIFTATTGIPEYYTWYGGITFIYSSGQVIYKNSSTLITQWQYERHNGELPQINMAQWNQTVGNPDTIWASSISIPQSIYPADSLYIRTSETEISKCVAKYLYYTRQDKEMMPATGSAPAQNANAILYYLSSSKKPNMKLQVSSIIIDSSKIWPWGNGRDYLVSGMTLRWAVDSLGNGLFRQTTQVRMTPQSACATTGIVPHRYSKVARLHIGEKGTLANNRETGYSLTGASSKSAKTAGVFIVPNP